MHTILILASLSLALVGCLVCARLLRFARSSVSRRIVQVAGLFLPVAILVLLSTLMAHFLSRVCFWTAPPPDVMLAEVLTAVGAVGIAFAILLNLVRAALLPLYLPRNTWDAPVWLQTKVSGFATDLGLRRAPRVLVRPSVHPGALVAGLFRPSLVVSTGLLTLLDKDELSAVLCHELLHIKRGDLWWAAICGVLRDLTWFLPVTRHLYKLMLAEQELACDDQLIGESRRLALASALARVWQAGIASGPTPRGALALFSPEHSASLEARVRRLLDHPGIAEGATAVKALLVVLGILMLFVVAQIGAAAIVMGQMGCGMQGMMH